MPDDTQLALIHYRMMFPDLASLGAIADGGTQPATWFAEYNRLIASGFSATLITASTFESGSATAIKNFDQKVLISALLTRRAELDCNFDDAFFIPPQNKMRQRLGITVRMSSGPGGYN